jgi:dTDP-4-dehydrorhamnose reductase
MKSRTILITGADGQLGSELCRQMQGRCIGLARSDCDLRDAGQLARVFGELRPAAVINTAAYTAVDRAEQEAALCRAVNAGAVETLAQLCDAWNCRLIQISTDYVFGGDESRTTPYRETDTPGPVNEYGSSKLAGEQAAARAKRHLIVRTCGLYGRRSKPTQSNFVDTMLRLARERDRLRIVCDQWCTPSYHVHVAAAILALLDVEAHGIVHVVNGGATTWHDFAVEIFRLSGAKLAIEAIPSTEYNAPARRPSYSVLDTAHLCSLTNRKPPRWQDALAEYLRSLGTAHN